VILPSGAFCTVTKYTTTTKSAGHDVHWLVAICEYWESEADKKAGKDPVLIHDHMWQSGILAAVDDNGQPDVLRRLIRTIDDHWKSGVRGNFLDGSRPDRTDDVAGFLKHPHVQALGAAA